MRRRSLLLKFPGDAGVENFVESTHHILGSLLTHSILLPICLPLCLY